MCAPRTRAGQRSSRHRPGAHIPAHADGRGERGAATAELALVIPLLVAVTAGLVWVLAVGAAQLRVVDAARETARALARGEAQEAAVGRGAEVAPEGSEITVATEGDRVRVQVTGTVPGPGGLLEMLPDAELTATAVAAVEEP